MLYSFDDYTLDAEHYELRQAGRLVAIEPRVLDVLAYLVQNTGRTVTTEELKEQLYPNQFGTDDRLTNAVAQARRVLGDTGQTQRYIQTVRRRGYRFVAPVTARPPEAGDLQAAPPQDLPQPPVTAVPDQTNAPSPLSQASSVSPSSRPQTPLIYTPVHLAEKILTSRSALEGERKQITVLYANLQGAAELLVDRDPEEAQRLLDPLLDRMMEAIHRYEGTVNHISGDGMIALFGAPLAHEDHAARACYAALAMQKAVLQRAGELHSANGIDIQLRAGLNSGEVVVRTISNDLHMEYAAVGQSTYLAAQLEPLVPPGAIWLAGETLRLVEGFVRVKPLDPVRIAGLTGPVEVFELLGAESTRTRLHATTARILTPFVGREQEIETLRQSLERASTGHGQVVAVIGEPGVGKSRLFYEFTQAPHTKGWFIFEAGAVASYGQATPYLPIIGLLKAYFQVEGPDDGREMHEQVTDKLLALDESLRPTLPAFFTLLDMPVEDPPWLAMDPPQRRQRMLDAVKRLLLRESQVQPLLVIMENLHWIDTETQAVLDSLIESLPTARLLLLVNYRPEYQHSWGNKTYYTQLRLDPLPPACAEELLHALLGRDASLQPLTQRLIERTGGNPFFLEESVWTLGETKALAGERGAYRVAQALPSIQVPATVQAMLAARIDLLLAEDKRLLQAAAVIGKDVPFILLQAIAEEPEEALRRSIAHLQAAEFLYETNLFPELEYTFKHALTHEVAYGSLLQERRRILHARIVDAIERLHPDQLDEQVDRIARHAIQGEVWAKAVAYFRQAGVKAFARSANREAVVCFEQALVALHHLPESRETCEQAIDLQLDLRNALQPLGEFRRVSDCLRKAETLAETLGDQHRLGWILSYKTNCLWIMGDSEQGIQAGHRALELAAILGVPDFQTRTNLSLGQIYYSLGDHRRALDFLRRNIMPLEGHMRRGSSSARDLIFSRVWFVYCAAEVGEFAEGTACAEEGVRAAEAHDDPYLLVQAYLGIGLLYLRKGDLKRALPVLERALEICHTANIQDVAPSSAIRLGYAYALSRRIAEALPLLEHAVEQFASTGQARNLSRYIAWLSEAYLLAECAEDALKLALQARELSLAYRERGHQAWALRLLGEILTHRDPLEVEQVEDYYRQAVALAEELGMRPLLGQCHFGLGSLYRRIGRLEHAYSELFDAIDLFRAMEMTCWLAQAQAELARMK